MTVGCACCDFLVASDDEAGVMVEASCEIASSAAAWGYELLALRSKVLESKYKAYQRQPL
jgi:hypothetical protein